MLTAMLNRLHTCTRGGATETRHRELLCVYKADAPHTRRSKQPHAMHAIERERATLRTCALSNQQPASNARLFLSHARADSRTLLLGKGQVERPLIQSGDGLRERREHQLLHKAGAHLLRWTGGSGVVTTLAIAGVFSGG